MVDFYAGLEDLFDEPLERPPTPATPEHLATTTTVTEEQQTPPRTTRYMATEKVPAETTPASTGKKAKPTIRSDRMVDLNMQITTRKPTRPRPVTTSRTTRAPQEPKDEGTTRRMGTTATTIRPVTWYRRDPPDTEVEIIWPPLTIEQHRAKLGAGPFPGSGHPPAPAKWWVQNVIPPNRKRGATRPIEPTSPPKRGKGVVEVITIDDHRTNTVTRTDANAAAGSEKPGNNGLPATPAQRAAAQTLPPVPYGGEDAPCPTAWYILPTGRLVEVPLRYVTSKAREFRPSSGKERWILFFNKDQTLRRCKLRNANPRTEE
ncbi:uncharacterized protein LOC143220232 [Lasioglossum baleicum]|uniref:uncharacterized protein LOC143220232 n=1 Tax=Lasioglossum baleicum TaxID=434251 RepID=UPI003FCCBA52